MYLIVGANGFLGSYIIKSVLENTDDNIVAVCRDISEVGITDKRIQWKSLDVSNFDMVNTFFEKLDDISKMKIIYLAAYHNPDLVEKNPEIAWDINITSLSYFLNKSRRAKCFFYPSSDSVYGNSVDGYAFKESDVLNPVNTYGKQKALAENLVISYGFNVVRYPFLIGPSLLTKKKHFYDKIVEEITSGRTVDMFSDSYRSTISFKQAADFLVNIIEEQKEADKAVNICADRGLSKYDVGIIIARKLGVDESLIRPVRVSESNNIFTAKRADSTLMDNTLLKSILGIDGISLTI